MPIELQRLIEYQKESVDSIFRDKSPNRIVAGKMLPQNLNEKIAKWSRETEEAIEAQ